MNNVILLKYGELFLKGKNRNEFVNLLKRDIKNKFDFNDISYDRGYAIIRDKVTEEQMEQLTLLFGISKIDLAFETGSDLKVINNTLIDLYKDTSGTFKVEAQRIDKKFEQTSDQIKRFIATDILEHTNMKVDVHNPENLIKVKVYKEKILVTWKTIEGIGGFPLNSSGRMLVLLSGGIDSPVAGFLLAKKGIHVDFIHFETPPSTTPEALEKVKKLHKKIQRFVPKSKLYLCNFTDIQNEIACSCNPRYRITIMRRYFLKIASMFAEQNHHQAIATGDSIGQVASQTLESIKCITEASKLPVIRPLSIMDKVDIIKIAKKIDTYEIAIEPFEDCCSIFVPKNPIIKPVLNDVIVEEEKMFAHNIVEETIKQIKTVF